MGGGGRRLVPAAFVAAALVLVVAAVFVSSAEAETAAASLRGGGPFDSIFAFGDSFTDTGNNPVVFGWYDIFDVVMRPPYGMTFFGGLPTGRNCNGRLVIDFIGEKLARSIDRPTNLLAYLYLMVMIYLIFQRKAWACLSCRRTCRTRGASGRAPTSPSEAPPASTPASSTSATPPAPTRSLSTSASKCSLAGSRSSSLPCAKRTKVTYI
jgi:hypothetical protein